MANKVVSSSGIKSIMNGGRSIALKYATETDTWKRLTLSTDIKDGFAKAMEKADVPALQQDHIIKRAWSSLHVTPVRHRAPKGTVLTIFSSGISLHIHKFWEDDSGLHLAVPTMMAFHIVE